MNFLYKKLVRDLLFKFDPETVHDAMIKSVGTLQDMSAAARAIELIARSRDLPVTVAGIRFKNPIGLAAGFDKNCEAPRILSKIGFGFLELGTVTLRPQVGNPRPRMFRAREHKGIINRLGFNNAGAYEAARKLERLLPVGIPVGLNIGKNADCSLDDAPKNYLEALKTLYPYGDYFTLNVSSPNTLRLRELHNKERLSRLIGPVLDFIAGASVKKPLFIKIAPDLEEAELNEVAETALQNNLGLIATNTTVRRDHLPEMWRSCEGGLSGVPLRDLSNETLRKLAKLTGGRVPLIGVGGIFDGPSAVQKFRLGADLIQVYSGLIYEGPLLVKNILTYMEKMKFSPARNKETEKQAG
ncbi:MAG: dihydroorotate dehydrogenase (quinone) [Elusimicrobia bacterium RIFOXYB2_FULL_62_6]|nr:MAG: dihydroorotate dehydrogenase (quinone) [Elusimicrobia bacterium RIFOXYB2_FULL_62_6]